MYVSGIDFVTLVLMSRMFIVSHIGRNLNESAILREGDRSDVEIRIKEF
jgi:hypothetical protein